MVIAVAHRLLETRPVVRRAAYALVGLVVLQGLLGGLRVLLDQLNLGGDGNFKAAAFAVGHAVNAQLTLALLAFIALAHSAAWHRAGRGEDPAPFRAGRWAAALEQVWAQPIPPLTLAVDGADVVADALVGFLT